MKRIVRQVRDRAARARVVRLGRARFPWETHVREQPGGQGPSPEVPLAAGSWVSRRHRPPREPGACNVLYLGEDW